MGSEIIHDPSDAEDRISSLPNHLLHHILRSVPTQDAVRMSVLSSRWQRVWIGVPTLTFDDKRSTAGFADSVDKVLAHNNQGTTDRLEISVRHPRHIARANGWLQQAAERVRETIRIIFPEHDGRDQIEMDLPRRGRTAAMTIQSKVVGIATIVIPPAVAVPSWLTGLELKRLRVDGSSLSNFVSSCCPHLKKLLVHTFGDMDVLKLHNNVLEDLDLDFYFGGVRRLEVSSRNLRRLSIIQIFSPEVRAYEVYDGSKVASFCTPRLEDLCLTCSEKMIHPSRIEFVHSLSTVRQLGVGFATHAVVHHYRAHRNKLAVWLLRRCTGVSSLKVSLCNSCPAPILVLEALSEVWLAQYEDLMVEIPQLSTVTDLTVTTIYNHHAYGASIAALLSRCSNVETLTIIISDKKQEGLYACAPAAACWCKRPAGWRKQKLGLDLLRQIDLMGFTKADWLPDLVSLLCCSKPAVLVNYCD